MGGSHARVSAAPRVRRGQRRGVAQRVGSTATESWCRGGVNDRRRSPRRARSRSEHGSEVGLSRVARLAMRHRGTRLTAWRTRRRWFRSRACFATSSSVTVVLLAEELRPPRRGWLRSDSRSALRTRPARLPSRPLPATIQRADVGCARIRSRTGSSRARCCSSMSQASSFSMLPSARHQRLSPCCTPMTGLDADDSARVVRVLADWPSLRA